MSELVYPENVFVFAEIPSIIYRIINRIINLFVSIYISFQPIEYG